MKKFQQSFLAGDGLDIGATVRMAMKPHERKVKGFFDAANADLEEQVYVPLKKLLDILTPGGNARPLTPSAPAAPGSGPVSGLQRLLVDAVKDATEVPA